jgi:hypothetical protein
MLDVAPLTYLSLIYLSLLNLILLMMMTAYVVLAADREVSGSIPGSATFSEK